MEFTLGRISFLFCAVWITVCCADEMSVQVFPHRPINYVSDKFISFTMSPADLVDIYKNHRFTFFQDKQSVKTNSNPDLSISLPFAEMHLQSKCAIWDRRI